MHQDPLNRPESPSSNQFEAADELNELNQLEAANADQEPRSPEIVVEQDQFSQNSDGPKSNEDMNQVPLGLGGELHSSLRPAGGIAGSLLGLGGDIIAGDVMNLGSFVSR